MPKSTPPLTRFLVDALSKSHWFDPSPSQNGLDYFPQISMEQARKMTVQWIKDSDILV